MSIQKQTKQKMEASIEHFKDELKALRTGQAHPGMLDKVFVEVYGSSVPIRDIANITKSEATQLVVKPYDNHNVGPISKAIQKADLGVSIIAEGDHVRITTPPMSAEVRKKMVENCHKLKENCKVSIRHERQEANKTVRDQKTKGDITEDEVKGTEKEIQKLTDDYCKKADEVAAEKEKQISTI